MASVPSSGPISFSNLANVFGGTPASGQVSLSQFHPVHNRIAKASGLREVGPVSLSNYLGKSKVVPGTIPNGTPIFIHSTRLINSNYTGPSVRIRRNNDNTLSDMFVNQYGEATTGSNSTGTSLSNWIGTANAFVTTFYDQSGNNYHAFQSNSSFQPRVELLPTDNARFRMNFRDGAFLLANSSVSSNVLPHDALQIITYDIASATIAGNSNGILLYRGNAYWAYYEPRIMASRATVTGANFGGSFANYAPDLTKTNTLMVQSAPGSTQQRYVWLNGNAVSTTFNRNVISTPSQISVPVIGRAVENISGGGVYTMTDVTPSNNMYIHDVHAYSNVVGNNFAVVDHLKYLFEEGLSGLCNVQRPTITSANILRNFEAFTYTGGPWIDRTNLAVLIPSSNITFTSGIPSYFSTPSNYTGQFQNDIGTLPSSNWTVVCMIRMTSNITLPDTWSRIISGGTNSSNAEAAVNGSGNLGFKISNTAWITSSTLPLNMWNMISLGYSASVRRVTAWLNSNAIITSNLSTNATTPTGFSLAQCYVSSNEGLPCQLAFVHMYDAMLSQADVNKLYSYWSDLYY
jgi:hypothetical protein